MTTTPKSPDAGDEGLPGFDLSEMLSVFRECGAALERLSPEERARTLVSLGILYGVTWSQWERNEHR